MLYLEMFMLRIYVRKSRLVYRSVEESEVFRSTQDSPDQSSCLKNNLSLITVILSGDVAAISQQVNFKNFKIALRVY